MLLGPGLVGCNGDTGAQVDAGQPPLTPVDSATDDTQVLGTARLREAVVRGCHPL